MGCVYSNPRLRDFETNPPRKYPAKRTVETGMQHATPSYNRNLASINITTEPIQVESMYVKAGAGGRSPNRGKGPGKLPEPAPRSYPQGDPRRIIGSSDSSEGDPNWFRRRSSPPLAPGVKLTHKAPEDPPKKFGPRKRKA